MSNGLFFIPSLRPIWLPALFAPRPVCAVVKIAYPRKAHCGLSLDVMAAFHLIPICPQIASNASHNLILLAFEASNTYSN